MPIGLRRGSVTSVVERHEEIVRLEVDGDPCIAYPRLSGDIEVGDDVVVNVQARELELGSGGFDVLVVNLTRGLGLAPAPGAHIMAWPYAPLQLATAFAEESGESGVEGTVGLAGTPVVCCGLHSQVAPVCAALAGLQVVYIQLAGGALPVSLSDALRALRRQGLLTETVGVAPCVDGDLACVTPASGLVTAKSRGAEVIVISIGPGIVGTATRLGHGGLAVVEAANAAIALGGRPIVAARVSQADGRERHRGLSHHTRTALELCLGEVTLAWPEGLAPPAEIQIATVAVDGWREACLGLPLSHMGRGPDDDPWFFASAFAAGRLARSFV